MISFKHRNVVKRLQLTKNISEERLSRMLGQIFPVKGPVLGFKTESGMPMVTLRPVLRHGDVLPAEGQVLRGGGGGDGSQRPAVNLVYAHA